MTTTTTTTTTPPDNSIMPNIHSTTPTTTPPLLSTRHFFTDSAKHFHPSQTSSAPPGVASTVCHESHLKDGTHLRSFVRSASIKTLVRDPLKSVTGSNTPLPPSSSQSSCDLSRSSTTSRLPYRRTQIKQHPSHPAHLSNSNSSVTVSSSCREVDVKSNSHAHYARLHRILQSVMNPSVNTKPVGQASSFTSPPKNVCSCASETGDVSSSEAVGTAKSSSSSTTLTNSVPVAITMTPTVVSVAINSSSESNKVIETSSGVSRAFHDQLPTLSALHTILRFPSKSIPSTKSGHQETSHRSVHSVGRNRQATVKSSDSGSTCSRRRSHSHLLNKNNSKAANTTTKTDPPSVNVTTTNGKLQGKHDSTSQITKSTIPDSEHSTTHDSPKRKDDSPVVNSMVQDWLKHGKDKNVIVMPDRYEYAETSSLCYMVSTMLNELVHLNDQLPVRNEVLTRFHSRAPPTISIADYLNRLVTHAALTPSLLLSVVYYIDRLCALYPFFAISSLTVHRFLIAAVTVAAKGLSDTFWTNGTYARVGGVSTRELGVLELELLSRLNWRIVPHPEVLVEYYQSLVNRTAGYTFCIHDDDNDHHHDNIDDGEDAYSCNPTQNDIQPTYNENFSEPIRTDSKEMCESYEISSESQSKETLDKPISILFDPSSRPSSLISNLASTESHSTTTRDHITSTNDVRDVQSNSRDNDSSVRFTTDSKLPEDRVTDVTLPGTFSNPSSQSGNSEIPKLQPADVPTVAVQSGEASLWLASESSEVPGRTCTQYLVVTPCLSPTVSPCSSTATSATEASTTTMAASVLLSISGTSHKAMILNPITTGNVGTSVTSAATASTVTPTSTTNTVSSIDAPPSNSTSSMIGTPVAQSTQALT